MAEQENSRERSDTMDEWTSTLPDAEGVWLMEELENIGISRVKGSDVFLRILIFWLQF